jgi:hypothetical protein
MDPGMHSPDEVRIIIDLFDGHMNLTENMMNGTIEKKLNVKRLYNKKYQNKDLTLKAN